MAWTSGSEARTTARTQAQRNALAKEALKKAALELFALKGYDSTSLAEIGVRAGYSRNLANYHFGNKTALAVALLEEMGENDLKSDLLRLGPDASGVEAWNGVLGHIHDRVEHFRKMLDGAESNLADRGEMILIATATFTQDPDLHRTLRRTTGNLIRHVRNALNICQRNAVIRADVDTQVAAYHIVSNVWGIGNVLFVAPEQQTVVEGMVTALEGYLNTLRT